MSEILSRFDTALGRLADRVPRPGVVAMMIAAVLFSLNAALAKILTSSAGRSFPSFQVLYARGIVTCLGSSGILLYRKQLPFAAMEGRIDTVLLAAGRGILGTIAIGSLYFALQYLPLTEANVLYGLNPVFAAIASRLLLQEGLSWPRIAAIPIFVGGVVVSADPSRLGGGGDNNSVVWGGRTAAILGAVSSGLAVVFARKMNAVERLHWSAQAWWQGTVAALVGPALSFLIPFVACQHPSDVALLFTMGMCAFLGQLCVGYAIQHEDATIVGILWNLDLVLSLLWQATMFSLVPSWSDAVGVALVFVASVVCVLEKPLVALTDRCSAATTEGGGVDAAQFQDASSEQHYHRPSNVIPFDISDAGPDVAIVHDENEDDEVPLCEQPLPNRNAPAEFVSGTSSPELNNNDDDGRGATSGSLCVRYRGNAEGNASSTVDSVCIPVPSPAANHNITKFVSCLQTFERHCTTANAGDTRHPVAAQLENPEPLFGTWTATTVTSGSFWSPSATATAHFHALPLVPSCVATVSEAMRLPSFASLPPGNDGKPETDASMPSNPLAAATLG